MTTVEKIHRDFDTAQDRLLAEATALISNIDVRKADRLAKVGFINSEPVVKGKKYKMGCELAKTIRHYKQTYPLQKFLTNDELDRICKKYKLIYAPIRNYIRDVPEKNLLEIEQLTPLNQSDVAQDEVFTEVIYGFDIVGVSAPRARIMGLPKTIPGLRATHFTDIDDWIRRNFPKVGDRKYICSKGIVHEISRSGLFIAAPRNHFDLRGLNKTGAFSFLNVRLTEIDDPIVFRYCKGGVQIVTKWGLEGNDESLINEKMN